MRTIVCLGSLLLIAAILVDAFEAVLLPRRVSHGYRLLRLFYRNAWWAWRTAVKSIPTARGRQTMLGVFGPLALLVVYSLWASGLVVAFGLLHWSLATPLASEGPSPGPSSYLYFSGTTFFTLGYGDLTPAGPLGRFLAVLESGLGFGFLAMVIGYHPVITQSFSRREVVISTLDARGGSPPSAVEVLLRAGTHRAELNADFRVWETWAAELLESSLSFPMLAYYRSQHDNQSWLAALTAMLDTCALVICETDRDNQHQARLTFAIARHAAVDLGLVFKIKPIPLESDRLGTTGFEELKAVLKTATIPFVGVPNAELKLAELRTMYEPFVNGLAHYFVLELPEFRRRHPKSDNWQTSAWMQPTPGLLDLRMTERGDHFD